MNPRNLFFFLTLAVGLLADQATKLWVVRNLEVLLDEIHIVPGVLSVVHAQNHGAAFSTFDGQLWLFLVFTVIALVIILDLFRRLPIEVRFMPFILGMILSGVLGNGLDRVRQAYVTDFIKVYTDQPDVSAWLISSFGTSVWPIFNIADSSLLVGVALFGLHYLIQGDEEPTLDLGDADPEPSAPSS